MLAQFNATSAVGSLQQMLAVKFLNNMCLRIRSNPMNRKNSEHCLNFTRQQNVEEIINSTVAHG